MTIGFVGCGKLGLPVAVAMRAHLDETVLCYDINPENMTKEPRPYVEAGPLGHGSFNDELARSDVVFTDLQNLVDHSRIIFVAVQTPHDERFGGEKKFPPHEVADFDYSWLKAACEQVAECMDTSDGPEKTIAIISTCLPGTTRRDIVPIFEEFEDVEVVYNPSFIAMGTTMQDFLNPEFVLIGGDEKGVVAKLYRSMYDSMMSYRAIRERTPITSKHVENDFVSRGSGMTEKAVRPPSMSIESAELAKVAYNTYIGMKIIWANTMMEICEHIPHADCDEVTDALAYADKRLHSPKYTKGGMGDSGGCHPRDGIAMSWLASKLELSCDFFGSIMECRQMQAEFIAGIVIERVLNTTNREDEYGCVIFGTAYKPEIGLELGSTALLVREHIVNAGMVVATADPFVSREHYDGFVANMRAPGVILIGINHSEFKELKFPSGSIVIDPWRMIDDQDGVEVIRIGERRADG